MGSCLAQLVSAEEVHFFVGATWLLVAYAIGFDLRWAFVLLVLFALVKEFWYDINIEKQTDFDGVRDFSFYMFGALIALLIIRFLRV